MPILKSKETKQMWSRLPVRTVLKYTSIFCRNFSQLTKQEIYDLYQRYKLDFELYGYSPDEYIAMGMDAWW